MPLREMQKMRVKIKPRGREQYAVWRANEHDDLVMAVALAAWWLKRNNLGGEARGSRRR